MTKHVLPKLMLTAGAFALALSLSACSTQAKQQAAEQGQNSTPSSSEETPMTTPEETNSTPATIVEGDRPQVVGEPGKPMVGFPKDMPAPTQNTVWVVEEGTGPEVNATDTVTAVYAGQLWGDGKLFDASYLHGSAPISFPLQGVIPGWTQGLTGQKVGSKVILGIPSEMGYGERGAGSDIPPNSDLAFYVEIVDAQPAA